MDNKITIYVCNDNKKGVVEPLLELESSYKTNIQVLGSGPQNENSFKEIVLGRVDVAITGLLSGSTCKTLAEMSPNTKILMLTNDDNRAKSIIADMSKNKIYNVAFLNLNSIAPKDVYEFILDNFPRGQEEVKEPELKVQSLNDVLDKKETETCTNKESDTTKKEGEDDVTKVATKATKLDLLNLKSKTIAVFSKKGGTGKTTIASELAHLYGNVTLPSKLGYDSKYLKTVLLDLDFEQGNVRSKLGIENPLPNNYVWIEDIINRLDKKEDIDDITYTSAQVMSQFTKKVNGEFYVAVNDQGGLPYRLVDAINSHDVDGHLFEKIVTVIIKSLKRAFDVVIIDLPSEFKEECLVTTKLADIVVYVTNPTIMDMENFKVFLDEVKEYSVLDFSKVVIVDNKEVKSGRIMELFDMIQKEIRYTTYSYDLNKNVELTVPVVAHLPWTTDCLVAESTYSFVTDRGSSLFKKELLKLAEYILPIFKVKTNHDAKKFNKEHLSNSTYLSKVGLTEASKKAKEKELAEEERLEKLKKEKEEKKNKHKKVKKGVVSTLNQENKIEGSTIDDGSGKKEPVEEKLDTSNKAVSKKKGGLFSLFRRKEETLPEFVARLIELSKNPKNRIKLDKNGFPHCLVKPAKTSSKVWKEYRLKLNEVNKALKETSEENKSSLPSQN